MIMQTDYPETFEPVSRLLKDSGITSTQLDKILAEWQPLTLKKGKYFSEAGQRSDKLGILVEGLLAARYEKHNSGKEIISRFYYSPKNIIVASFESFYSDKKAEETIEALEDSYLLVINKQSLYTLYDEVPETNRIGRLLSEQSYIQALQRIHQLQAMTVKERLEDFNNCHPELANRIQVQHLCSYIGTNRNALAKLTNNGKK